MKHFRIIALVVLLVPMCNTRKNFDKGYFAMGERQGALDYREIDEASGLAASVVNEGMLWTHNDSGDEARIFLIDQKGVCKAVVSLDGVTNRDWEEIAVGPGPEPGKSYVYVGEIGDNRATYLHKYLYRFPEPEIPVQSGRIDTTIYQLDSIKFTLEGGPRDTEAFIVDPVTRDIYVFSKNEKKNIRVFRLPYPQSTTDVMEAEFVMQLPIVKVVAADISADGREILIKNYTHVFYWRKEPDEPIPSTLERQPFSLPYTTEPQGEAVAFDRAGKGYFTLSEEHNNTPPWLLFYPRVSDVK
ncbi:MAG: hypothetical protein DIU61_000540 [Bacteroidota bacterium]|jgi:hypothetical protein|nr:MAG: hypothetical protein DIU61_04785 [Bacteroidota bacterium]